MRLTLNKAHKEIKYQRTVSVFLKFQRPILIRTFGNHTSRKRKEVGVKTNVKNSWVSDVKHLPPNHVSSCIVVSHLIRLLDRRTTVRLCRKNWLDLVLIIRDSVQINARRLRSMISMTIRSQSSSAKERLGTMLDGFYCFCCYGYRRLSGHYLNRGQLIPAGFTF